MPPTRTCNYPPLLDGLPIIGAKRIEQLEDNLLAVDVTWTDDELAELAELTAPASTYPYWMLANFSR